MTHYPGPPRDRFLEAVENYHKKSAGLRELLQASRDVLGCTDILPRGDRDLARELLEPFDGGAEPWTYGEAAKRLLSIHKAKV